MNLRKWNVALVQQLLAAPDHPLFKDARTRNKCLAGLDTIMAVLGTISAGGYTAAEPLLRALVAEQQRRPDRLWSSALLVALGPALVRLRSRIHSNAADADDMDTLVVTSFMDAVAGFDLAAHPDRTFMRLVQVTKNGVFRELGMKQLMDALVEPVADFRELDRLSQRGIEWVFGERWKRPNRVEAEAFAGMLRWLVGDTIDASKLAVVIATKLRGQSLRSYVNERYASYDRAFRERRYQQMKRANSRTLARIRRFLEELIVPDCDDDPLDL